MLGPWTFSLVAILKFIRILVTTTIYYDYEICQMDVKIDFLRENVEEDVSSIVPNTICKLQNSTYELKLVSMS